MKEPSDLDPNNDNNDEEENKTSSMTQITYGDQEDVNWDYDYIPNNTDEYPEKKEKGR